jgi:thermostable 8-oxoguanine DNA glycosylase
MKKKTIYKSFIEWKEGSKSGRQLRLPDCGSLDGAILAWNARQPEVDEKDKQIDELKKMYKELEREVSGITRATKSKLDGTSL